MDFQVFLRVMNGCEGEIPVDQGWVAFWPVQRWRIVRDLDPTSAYPEAVVFADHCQESWW
jgi:hypothetical protein